MTLTKNIFTGEYSYSIDSKNRVNIPSNFRNCLSSDNKKTFVITKGLDSCIWVYPLIFWKKIENDLKKLSSISNTNRAFIRNTAIQTFCNYESFFIIRTKTISEIGGNVDPIFGIN